MDCACQSVPFGKRFAKSQSVSCSGPRLTAFWLQHQVRIACVANLTLIESFRAMIPMHSSIRLWAALASFDYNRSSLAQLLQYYENSQLSLDFAIEVPHECDENKL